MDANKSLALITVPEEVNHLWTGQGTKQRFRANDRLIFLMTVSVGFNFTPPVDNKTKSRSVDMSKLTRRRFGQVVLASTAIAGVGAIAGRILAQTTTELTSILTGVIIDPQASATQLNTAPPRPLAYSAAQDSGDAPPPPLVPTVTETTTSDEGELVLRSLNLQTLQVQEQKVDLLLDGATDQPQPFPYVSGLTYLVGGTSVLSTNATRSRKKGQLTRLTVLEPSTVTTRTLTVSGLKKQDALESLAGTNDNRLVGLVVRKKGKGVARFVDVNIDTGQASFTDRFKLPDTERFSTLTQCSDGTFYSTAIAPTGETTLVKLVPGQRQPIRLSQLSLDEDALSQLLGKGLVGDDPTWYYGLESLACSASGELFALGGPRYGSTNYLFKIDISNGVMSLLREFGVAKIAFVRT